MSARSVRRADILLITAFCLLWSSAFAVGKLGLAYSPPLLFLSARFLAAGLLMTGAAWVLGQLRALDLRSVCWLALLGVLNNALYLGLSFSGMVHVSAGLTSVVIAATPVVTGALAVPLLAEPLNRRKMLGLVLGVAGVAVVVRGRIGAGTDEPAALLLTFGALASLSLGTLLFKKARLTVPLLTASGLQVLIGGLALLPVALLLENPAAIRLSWAYGGILAWMVFGASIGAYLAWFGLLQRRSAAAASAWHFALPPLGLGFGWLLLGETVQPLDFLGILPVALGIALATGAPLPGLPKPAVRANEKA